MTLPDLARSVSNRLAATVAAPLAVGHGLCMSEVSDIMALYYLDILVLFDTMF